MQQSGPEFSPQSFFDNTGVAAYTSVAVTGRHAHLPFPVSAHGVILRRDYLIHAHNLCGVLLLAGMPSVRNTGTTM
jgi:hypothetical protein